MSAAAGLAEKWHKTRVRHHHAHPPVVNVNLAAERELRRGDRVADRFANLMGSWRFIIVQSVLLMAWLVVNAVAYFRHWDPYPFILLNLALSFQAAYTAPIIMMSQNRQATKDRIAAEHDYRINVKAEEEIKAIMQHLEQQDELMIDILRDLERQHEVVIAAINPAAGGAPADPGHKS